MIIINSSLSSCLLALLPQVAPHAAMLQGGDCGMVSPALGPPQKEQLMQRQQSGPRARVFLSCREHAAPESDKR